MEGVDWTEVFRRMEKNQSEENHSEENPLQTSHRSQALDNQQQQADCDLGSKKRASANMSVISWMVSQFDESHILTSSPNPPTANLVPSTFDATGPLVSLKVSISFHVGTVRISESLL